MDLWKDALSYGTPRAMSFKDLIKSGKIPTSNEDLDREMEDVPTDDSKKEKISISPFIKMLKLLKR